MIQERLIGYIEESIKKTGRKKLFPITGRKVIPIKKLLKKYSDFISCLKIQGLKKAIKLVLWEEIPLCGVLHTWQQLPMVL